jgi:hypothetical protein
MLMTLCSQTAVAPVTAAVKRTMLDSLESAGLQLQGVVGQEGAMQQFTAR